MKKKGVNPKSKKEVIDTCKKDYYSLNYNFFDCMISILFETKIDEDSNMEDWKNASFII